MQGKIVEIGVCSTFFADMLLVLSVMEGMHAMPQKYRYTKSEKENDNG